MKKINKSYNYTKAESIKLFKKKYIKNKIINNFIKHGKKNTGEKNLLKSFKELLKTSNKQTKKLIQLSLISTLPIFKVHKISNKKLKKKTKKIKEIPSFIFTKNARISLAIKFILNTTQKEKYAFYNNFKKEILSNAQKIKSNSINIKNELQKQALIKKHYLINYKWL